MKITAKIDLILRMNSVTFEINIGVVILVSAQVWEYKRIVMLEMQFETLTFFVSSLTYF